MTPEWLDAAGVGRMIGHTARQVRERIALLPDFPRPARIGGTGHPRWRADEAARNLAAATRETAPLFADLA